MLKIIMDDSFKTILERLIAFPLRSQIKIGFNIESKVFRLTAPIFSSKKLSPAVKNYVEARKGRAFKPHATTFILEGDQKVLLVQELPFQPVSLRGQVSEFGKLAKHCHRLLMELALEESYKDVMT